MNSTLTTRFALVCFVVAPLQAQTVPEGQANQPAAVAADPSSSAQAAELQQKHAATEALRNQVAALQAASTQAGAVAAQADLIEAQADLMTATTEEGKAKARLAESLTSPAMAAQFRAMENDLIKAKSTKEREAVRNRLILLRRQENERVAAQMGVLGN